MQKIFITTQTGQKVEVGVVRLFKNNDNVFFIYTLSEKDANNYVKLYVTKVNMDNLQSVVITDESEWSAFKEIMKTIIKNNRNNTPLTITDLDAKTIENIVVYDPKVFKLSEEMTNFLQMNVNLTTSVGEVVPSTPQSTIPNVFSTPTVDPIVNNASSAIDSVPEAEALAGDIGVNPEPAGVNVQNDVSEPEVPETTVIPTVVSSEPTEASVSIPGSAPVAENNVDVNVASQPEVPSVPENSQNIVEANDSKSVSEGIDYKVAYLEEQLKLETLNTKIATLEAQIKLLEQKIEQVKKIVE